MFTKSATEAINLVAFSLTGSIKPGDEILISEIEHHANLVPWQQLRLRTGATLRWFTVTARRAHRRGPVADHRPDEDRRGDRPVERHRRDPAGRARSPRLAHEAGALVLCDGAQLVPHHPVDVRALGVDFLAFSGHKMLGPLGLGVLYGKYAQLDALPPFLTGGSMIEVVRMEETTFLPPPAKFEPGVPAVSLAAGLGAAVDYLTALGMDNVAAHEESLTAHALDALGEIPGVRILGPADHRETAAAPSRSRWKACTRTTSARCSTSWASRSGPATTARGRCTGRSAARRPTAPASTCTTRTPR